MPLVDAVNEIDWHNEPRSIPLLEPTAWGYTTLAPPRSHSFQPTLTLRRRPQRPRCGRSFDRRNPCRTVWKQCGVACVACGTSAFFK